MISHNIVFLILNCNYLIIFTERDHTKLMPTDHHADTSNFDFAIEKQSAGHVTARLISVLSDSDY